MKATIELWMETSTDIIELVRRPLEVESISSPPGGTVSIDHENCSDRPLLKMTTEDLSTSRAMLNSYLGLITIAVDAATGQ